MGTREKLACGKWEADEVDGWEMTTIMANTLNAVAVYRTPWTDNNFVYMVIKDIWWAKNQYSYNVE